MKTKKLVLFGDSAFAEIAFEYFTYDSEYEVTGFTVSEEYLEKNELFGLPVVPFESVEEKFSPSEHEMHIALVYNSLNRIRAKFYNEAKSKGYKMANYVSSRAFIWHNVTMGDNVFIFEDNTIQPFVKLGSNIVFWSGNHIGHHSTIEDHNFISSHVVVSGFCKVGKSSFLGVNSTINNNVTIGQDNLIGSGCLIVKDTPEGAIFKGQKTDVSPVNAYKKFNIE